MKENKRVAKQEYQGNDRLLLGMVLGVITFWLFAQTTLNIAPTIKEFMLLWDIKMKKRNRYTSRTMKSLRLMKIT
ncbi:MAG: hypothetical protein ACRKFN_05265 [Desulfitobacterium sp.]